jgi:serine/threonine protein kinase
VRKNHTIIRAIYGHLDACYIELCTLKHPFESNNQGALILKIVKGKYNPISSSYSKDLSAMVDLCLCKDYKKEAKYSGNS